MWMLLVNKYKQMDGQIHTVGKKCGRQMFANAGRAGKKRWSAFYSLVCLSLENKLCGLFCPAEHTNIQRKTHLPKHGCQSSYGWLQDIILSVSAYEHLHHTSCGLFICHNSALNRPFTDPLLLLCLSRLLRNVQWKLESPIKSKDTTANVSSTMWGGQREVRNF